MADQAITALPKKTYSGSSQIAATDYLLGIDSAEGYQMLIQDLGEYIINRATASLAGSTQTLASAISALNSKYKWQFNVTSTITSQAENLPDGKTMYFGTVSGYGKQTELDSPDNTNAYVEVYRWSAAYITIKWVSINEGLSGNVYTRTKNGSVWGEWIKLPNRTEMDAVTNVIGGSVLNLPANSTVSYTISNNARMVLFVLGADSNGMCIYNIATTSSGGVHRSKIGTASHLSETYAANTMTITNSDAANLQIRPLIFAGTITAAS